MMKIYIGIDDFLTVELKNICIIKHTGILVCIALTYFYNFN